MRKPSRTAVICTLVFVGIVYALLIAWLSRVAPLVAGVMVTAGLTLVAIAVLSAVSWAFSGVITVPRWARIRHSDDRGTNFHWHGYGSMSATKHRKWTREHIRRLKNQFVNRRQTMLSSLAFFGCLGALLVLMLLRSTIPTWAQWVVFVPFMVVLVAVLRWIDRLHQRSMIAFIRASCACGCCGYSIRGVPCEQDGCRVCPECQCAWRLAYCPECAGELDKRMPVACEACGWRGSLRELDAGQSG